VEYYSQVGWVDDYVKNIAPYIHVRRQDALLIKIPNEAYKLNAQAMDVLRHILDGGSVYDIVNAYPEREKVAADIHHFFCDLRAVLKGCYHEQEPRRAVEKVPFALPFNTLQVLSEIALTYQCNLECAFCYASCGCSKQKDVPELSTGDMKAVLDVIRNEAEIPSVSFTGGEPTLREDLPELVGYAKSLNMWTNLITNGTLVTRAYARALSEAGLDSAQVSLEAGEPGLHDAIVNKIGAFTLTIEGIKDLRCAGIRVHTNTTISGLNRKALLPILDRVRSLGLDKFSMNMLMPQGSALEHKQETLIRYSEIGDIVLAVAAAAKKRGLEFMWYSPTPMCVFNPIPHGLGNKGCAACDGLLSVAPNGDILPCSSFPRPMGNILTMTGRFREAWGGEAFRFFQQKKFAHAQCQSCKQLAVCNGGCPLYWDQVGYEEIMGEAKKVFDGDVQYACAE
jgi:radical SAM protein with 4Fe4S-binding SPASM domain